MVFVLAPDSFKESLTAQEACEAMENGIKEVLPQATCVPVPMADGGEGTMRALVAATGGTIYQQQVTAPLGNLIIGEYGILGDGKTGVVELASASGLHLVPPEKRNPWLTTTYGTGELIKAALAHNITKLIIGIGGSATNDGGVGIAQALGVSFLDKAGLEIGRGGGALSDIQRIDLSGLITRNTGLSVEVACDVTNPLTGELGASRVYGPQKGATKSMILTLDQGLGHYAAKIKEYLGKDVIDTVGAGAAGGAGAGLLAFLDANLVKGIELVIKHSGLEEKIKTADYIFTGEGSIDQQTAYGKTISGIVTLAQKYNKPVIAFAGKIADQEALYQLGITAVFGIMPGVCTLEEALKAGKRNLENSVLGVVKLIQVSSGK